jgi:hypothetical protein
MLSSETENCWDIGHIAFSSGRQVKARWSLPGNIALGRRKLSVSKDMVNAC